MKEEDRLMEKIFYVPWGSENVCFWCKKRSDCQELEKLPERAGISKGSSIFYARMAYCRIDEFEADEKRLPKEFKGHTIKQRPGGNKLEIIARG